MIALIAIHMPNHIIITPTEINALLTLIIITIHVINVHNKPNLRKVSKKTNTNTITSRMKVNRKMIHIIPKIHKLRKIKYIKSLKEVGINSKKPNLSIKQKKSIKWQKNKKQNIKEIKMFHLINLNLNLMHKTDQKLTNLRNNRKENQNLSTKIILFSQFLSIKKLRLLIV